MFGELLSKTIEKSSEVKSQDVGRLNQFDARIRSEKADQTSAQRVDRSYDPGDRIKESSKPEKVERVESLGQLVKEYFEDIKNNSDYPETIPDEPFKTSDLKIAPSEVTRERRKEFESKKNSLISEWEKKHGIDWPTYDSDVKDANGNIIREKGNRYDAHHIQPLCFDGKNEVDNITPLHAEVHYDAQGVHAANRPFSKIDVALRS